MKRIKFKLATWNLGRNFMEQLSVTTDTPIEERDEYLVLESDDYSAKFFPDPRGFALITCKTDDEDAELHIMKMKEKIEAKK